jgi:hypothetical protein
MVLLMTGTLSQEILDKRNQLNPSVTAVARNDSDLSLMDGHVHVETAGTKDYYEATQTVALVAFCVGMWQVRS